MRCIDLDWHTKALSQHTATNCKILMDIALRCQKCCMRYLHALGNRSACMRCLNTMHVGPCVLEAPQQTWLVLLGSKTWHAVHFTAVQSITHILIGCYVKLHSLCIITEQWIMTDRHPGQRQRRLHTLPVVICSLWLFSMIPFDTQPAPSESCMI